MHLSYRAIIAIFFAVSLFSSTPALAASDQEMEQLKQEIETLRSEYEDRISQMEKKLSEMKSESQEDTVSSKSSSNRIIYNRDFNPSIGIILGGRYANFSSDEDSIPGFPLGHEGERGREGMSLGESELNVSANVDDKFYGSTTVALVDEGDATEIELEEAYFETLPGLGLPTGATIKAGKAFWTLGYLNEHHAHADDFADRPLPYRVFLDNSYNDMGAQLSYVLPTEFYSEVGGGIFRGDDTPFANGEGSEINAFSAFLRVGGDLGSNSSWRIGGYVLDGEANGRGGGHGEEHEEHMEEDGDHMDEDGEEGFEELFSEGLFTGDTTLYAVDIRYVWAPGGNVRQSELILQGEYFRRSEEGVYLLEEDGEVIEENLDGSSHGWYAQSVFKFSPKWRTGVRYSKIYAPEDSGIDHDPYAVAVMGDWTNSEFSRVRFQYNYEKLAGDGNDNQFIVQYIMSIGAHGAHKF